jgi:hypothetical protein
MTIIFIGTWVGSYEKDFEHKYFLALSTVLQIRSLRIWTEK